MMARKITIIGAGITGIMTASILHTLEPSLELIILDAGPEPKFADGSGKLGGHYGATLGHGRDARHFTGVEGLSFQNPIHTKLLFESVADGSPGWQGIPENELTIRERQWREECLQRYRQHVKPEHNPYDHMYTTLNYAGLASWDWLTELSPGLTRFRLSKDYVYEVFSTPEALRVDIDYEANFNPYQEHSPLILVGLDSIHENPEEVIDVSKIYRQLLRIPGETWAIQSVWQHLYKALSSQLNIKFQWNSPVERIQTLPLAETYIWAAGNSYAIPDIYSEHGRVQGIGGWWLSLPNHGFKAPFKFAAPQPSGVMNFTPNEGLIHISGGFGWVGERGYHEAKLLLEPVRKHFIQTIARFFSTSSVEIDKYEPGFCIRPTTPTGLPDIKTHLIHGKKHIMISGAGKAGATQAPLLALHVAQQLGLKDELHELLHTYKNQKNLEVIQNGLELFKTGFEP